MIIKKSKISSVIMVIIYYGDIALREADKEAVRDGNEMVL